MKVRTQQKNQKLKMAIVKQIITLATGGFGLVAALAWNNTIQEITNNFVKNYIMDGAGIISFLLYAFFVAILFAITGKQLAGFLDTIEKERERKS